MLVVAEGMSPIRLTSVVHRVGVDGIIGVAELGVAGGQEQVVVVQRLHHVERRKAAGLHLLAVEIGHHGPHLAAVDHRGHAPGMAMIMLRTS